MFKLQMTCSDTIINNLLSKKLKLFGNGELVICLL